MRTLLFVQNGEGRPKAWNPGREYVEHPPRIQMHADAWRLANPTPARCGARLCAVIRADRWWLVECENAEAGRATIAHEPFGAAVHRVGCACKNGRILASGGKP